MSATSRVAGKLFQVINWKKYTGDKMVLWDALTGKILHFNKMKQQANREVCSVLKTFVSSRLPDYPYGEKMFVSARNFLYAYYVGTTIVFSSGLEDLFAKYKQSLFSLNSHDYRRLACALHTWDVVRRYLDERDTNENAESWFNLSMEGVSDMYGQSYEYAYEWTNRLDWIVENDPYVVRLSGKIYDEIAPILGLPQIDPIESLFWTEIAVMCVEQQRALFERPDWNFIVESELAAPGTL